MMDSQTSATTADQSGNTTSANHSISQSKVAVSEGFYWTPIGPDTPRGVKLQMLTKGGVATYNVWNGRDPFYTHWAPLPKRRHSDAAS